MWGRCKIDYYLRRRRLSQTPPSPIFHKRYALLLNFSFLSELVRFKPKMTSTGYTLYLQQGAGKYEDSEESDFSQESEVSSQGTESSQEETESLEPWSRIFDEAEKRHETQLKALINEYDRAKVMRTLMKKLRMRELIREHRKPKTTTTFALHINVEILLRHTPRLIRPCENTETLLLWTQRSYGHLIKADNQSMQTSTL